MIKELGYGKIIAVIIAILVIGGASAFILTSDSDDDKESGSETTYYEIVASSSTGGNISPSGEIKVAEGESQTFTFTADTDYELSHIMVDGKRKEVSGSTYTFNNVSKDYTINAVFEKTSKPITPSQPSYKPTKYVVGMEIEGTPGTQYLFNPFNGNEITVTVKYSDGTQKVTTDYDVSPAKFDKIGTETVTISYTGFEKVFENVTVEIGPETPISNIDELTYFAELVNNGHPFSGKRVYLENNIDIEGVNWEPIGESKDVCFKGEFDGCGWTISNLKVNNPDAPAGLFGVLEGTVQDFVVSDAEIVGGEYVGTIVGYIPSSGKIKNVVVEDAVINGNHWVGGIVGYAYGSVMNCTVIGETTITATPNEKNAGGYDNGDKVGGIIGYLGEGRYSVTGNKVIGTETKPIQIKAYRDIGGIIGAAQSVNTGTDKNNNSISGNSASNVIIAIDQNYNGYDGSKTTNVGKIIGRIMGGTSDTNSVVENVVCHVYGITALQNVVDDTETNSVFKEFTLAEDIIGDLTVTQKPDVKITIDGNGKIFAGVITVDGKSKTYTTAGLDIKNIVFRADSISADACIRLGDDTNDTRYTCNVTVSGCTFDVPNMVGVKSYTGGDKNLTIKGCTITEKSHSLAQLKGIDGVLVEECEVYSKNGINFNNSTNVTVSGCTVNVKGYTVRFGESSGGAGAAETYTISDCTLTSANDDGDAVIILRGTADNSTLNIINTTMNGDPQITNTATGATIIIDGKYYANSDMIQGLINNADVKEIILSKGDFSVDIYNIPSRKSLIITGQGEGTSLKFENQQVRLSQFEELTIENCKIEHMATKSWGHLVFGSSNKDGGVYNIVNCIFDGCGTQGIYINQTVKAEINIEGCTFSGDFGNEGAITIQNNDGVEITVNVEDCKFENIPSTSHEICVLYAYNGFTLNVDDGITPYCKANGAAWNPY